MLYYETVRPSTLALLKKIMAVPELEDFNLAGGTALALQLGHRISIDLDFFGQSNLPLEEIISLLSERSKLTILTQSRNILVLNIEDIKVDFVNYKYPLLKPFQTLEGIRLVAPEDIAAMKLAAVAGRGRKRDFYDLYFLLQQFQLDELIQFYNDKYPDGSEFMIVKSLIYFDDAELDEDPILLKEADWQLVKTYITKEVNRLYR